MSSRSHRSSYLLVNLNVARAGMDGQHRTTPANLAADRTLRTLHIALNRHGDGMVHSDCARSSRRAQIERCLFWQAKPHVARSRPHISNASRTAVNSELPATRLCAHRAANIPKLDVSGPRVHPHIPISFCVQADITAPSFRIETARHG